MCCGQQSESSLVVLKAHIWLCPQGLLLVGDHILCPGSNLGWLHAMEMLFWLPSLSSSRKLSFKAIFPGLWSSEVTVWIWVANSFILLALGSMSMVHTWIIVFIPIVHSGSWYKVLIQYIYALYLNTYLVHKIIDKNRVLSLNIRCAVNSTQQCYNQVIWALAQNMVSHQE